MADEFLEKTIFAYMWGRAWALGFRLRLSSMWLWRWPSVSVEPETSLHWARGTPNPCHGPDAEGGEYSHVARQSESPQQTSRLPRGLSNKYLHQPSRPPRVSSADLAVNCCPAVRLSYAQKHCSFTVTTKLPGWRVTKEKSVAALRKKYNYKYNKFIE